jgi:hypothetical protein
LISRTFFAANVATKVWTSLPTLIFPFTAKAARTYDHLERVFGVFFCRICIPSRYVRCWCLVRGLTKSEAKDDRVFT